MSHPVSRGGWHVENPWVFANYGQPQRMRGRVSPIVFQSQYPAPSHAYLGESVPTEVNETLVLQRRMYWLSVFSTVTGVLGLFYMWQTASRVGGVKQKLAANRRRSSRRSR